MLKQMFITFVFLIKALCLFSQDFVLHDANRRKIVFEKKTNEYAYDYRFRLEVARNLSQFELIGVWIDSLFFEAKLYKDVVEIPLKANLHKDEWILIYCQVKNVYGLKGSYTTNHIKPFEKKPKTINQHSALIFYKIKGKRRYHIVYDVETLPPIYLQ